MSAATGRRIVIAGNGMAGAQLATLLGRRPDLSVTIIGDENHAAYNRIRLSSALSGDCTVAEIAMDPANAHAVLGDAIASIDRERKTVRTASGRDIAYDTLVLATGSLPIMLDIPGASLPGVLGFRTLDDVAGMMTAALKGGNAVVIGGGLLGLEAAEGLRRRGMTVSVVHRMPWLMERQLDAEAASVLQAELEARGIAFHLSAETQALLGETHVTGVRLKSGETIPADIVVMAVGIRPNIALARDSGLACGRGVQVDDTMRTADPAIYAVGECAEHRSRCYGLFAPIQDQLAICAQNIGSGAGARYEGSTEATSLKVTGVSVYSAGAVQAADGDDEIVLSDPRRGVYRKLVLRGDALIGTVLVGDVSEGAWFNELITGGGSIADLRGDLIFGRPAEPALLAA